MSDNSELLQTVRDLARRMAELERQLANLPVRFNQGGGAGDVLPPGGKKYQVLMKIDDIGSIDWEFPRFHK